MSSSGLDPVNSAGRETPGPVADRFAARRGRGCGQAGTVELADELVEGDRPGRECSHDQPAPGSGAGGQDDEGDHRLILRSAADRAENRSGMSSSDMWRSIHPPVAKMAPTKSSTICPPGES